jgi:hypothetical protein
MFVSGPQLKLAPNSRQQQLHGANPMPPDLLEQFGNVRDWFVAIY